jgi:hypothetical protein
MLMPPGQGGGVRLVETTSPPAPPFFARLQQRVTVGSNFR